jgi:fatty acid desaturase
MALIASLFLANVVVYFAVDSWEWLLLWFAVNVVPRGGVAAYNHHHQHLNVFHGVVANRALELMYGLMTGLVSHAWVLHHSVGHHVNYLDQQKDESRWRRRDGRPMGELEYTVVVALTAYPRAWRVGQRYPAYRRTMAWMGALTLLILAVALWHRPLPALMVFVIPMIFGLFHTVWATYTHHAGKSTESHHVASNNIMHRGYNWLTGNLGYHTAHHAKPGTHWSRLPALHATMAHLIPDDCYVSPGFPFRLSQQLSPRPRVRQAERTI